MSIKINADKCSKDHKCPAVKICPVEAIYQKDFNIPEVDDEICIDCGACVNYCSNNAIEKQ